MEDNLDTNPAESVSQQHGRPAWPQWLVITGVAVFVLLAAGMFYFAATHGSPDVKHATTSNKVSEGTVSVDTPTAEKHTPVAPDDARNIQTTEQGAYTIPIDATIKNLIITVIFKPEKRDRTYDIAEQTGGQNFYLQPSEINKFAAIEQATRGDGTLLFVSDTFKNSTSRDITITAPSGKTLSSGQGMSRETWSAGEVMSIQHPETGNWQLRVAGSGEFSVKATAVSSITVHGYDFVKLEAKDGREGPYSDFVAVDKAPAIGATQILQVKVLNDIEDAPPPKFYIVSESGTMLDSPHFYTIERGTSGTFIGTLTIPKQPFRIMARGVDEQGLPYQRVYAQLIVPEHKPAPLSKTELDEFTRTMEAFVPDTAPPPSALPFLKAKVGDEVTIRGNIIALKNDLPVDGSATITVQFSDEQAAEVTYAQGENTCKNLIDTDSTWTRGASVEVYAKVWSAYPLRLSTCDSSAYYIKSTK